MNKLVLLLLIISIQGCSNIYSRFTYEFNSDKGDPRIHHEEDTEDLVKLAKLNLERNIKFVESNEFIAFKNPDDINIFIFNDKDRYSNFSFTSNKTRGSATTNEIYLSPILRERIESFNRVLRHELSHVHLRQYIGTWTYTTNIPGWFHEGLAVETSGGGGAENVNDEAALNEIKNGRHFALYESGSLFGHESSSDFNLTPHMYYKQASLFVRHLQNKNIQAFKNCYIGLTQGEEFRQVWIKYYGKSLNGLWSEFLLKTQA